MATSGGRIKFPGNPWPRGHAVKKAKWTAELTPEGLRFHFDIESCDYDAEDDREDSELVKEDWKSRGAWTNFHACHLSSTAWGHPGFLVAKPGKPIDLERLEGKTFRVDRMTEDRLDEDQVENLSFGIYLLGHDSVCDHRIRFVKRRGPSTYDVTWRARIAHTYFGRLDLDHSLKLDLPKLRLDSIDIDSDLDTKSAKALIPQLLARSDRYRVLRRKLAREG